MEIANIEFDGYLAGFATTIIAGGKININKLRWQFEKIKIGLSKIDNISGEDRLIHDACIKYMKALEEVVFKITE